MKKIFLSIFLLVSAVNSAQFEDIFASEGDANKYVTNYMSPVFDGLIAASSAGWASSAKPLKPFSFSLDIIGSGAMVPDKNKTFKFNQSDYHFLRIESGPSDIPTVVGNDSQTQLSIVIPTSSGTEQKVLEFDAAGGVLNQLPMNMIAMPKLQLSMGLPLGTEVSLRYIPKLSQEDKGYAGLFGLGVKHSLSQYFPIGNDENGNKKKRKFNLAIQASYEKISAGTLNSSNDKNVELSLSSINVQGIMSYDMSLLTIYGAVGYTQGNSNVKVKGTYSYTYDVQDNSGNHLRYETVQIVDPLTLDFKPTSLRGTFGIRLNLLLFRIFADYTIQEYPTANVGIGFKI